MDIEFTQTTSEKKKKKKQQRSHNKNIMHLVIYLYSLKCSFIEY